MAMERNMEEREGGVKGRGRVRESEKRGSGGEENLSLSLSCSSICSCLREHDRAENSKERRKVEEERGKSSMDAWTKEKKSKDNVPLHCTHEMETVAERRRIERKNSHVRARGRKQGREEKEGEKKE